MFGFSSNNVKTWSENIETCPENTKNMILARSQNIKTMGGLGMLLYQAIPSFESFFGVDQKFPMV